MTARLPDETVQMILDLYREGLTYDQICDRCNVGRNAVKRYVKKHNLPRRFKRTGFTEDRIPELQELLSDPHLRTPEIAARIGCSEPMLHLYMRKYGLDRSPENLIKVRALPDAETITKIRELHADNTLSLQNIATELGMPMSRLRIALDHLGLPTTRVLAPRSQVLSDAQIQELKKLYVEKDRFTIQDLCDHFGISETALTHAIKIAGLPSRGAPRRELSAAQVQELKRLYEEGASLNSLSEKFSIYKARIYRELEAIGVERRDDKRRPERILSDEEIDYLERAYFNSSQTLSEICIDFEIGTTALYRYLDQRQAGRRNEESGRAKELSATEERRIVDLYRDEALTVPQICHTARITEWTLYRMLSLAAEPRRMQESKERLQDPDFIQLIAELYRDVSMGVREICDANDLPESSLRKIIELAGLEPRSPKVRKR